MRVTFQVKDRWLAIARETDPERLRKNLEGTPNSPHFIAEQVANLERLQTMAPMRVVAFLLDPRHGYGVAEREEWTAAGQRIVRIQSEDWKYYESVGIWLPSRCVASYYAHPLTLSEFSDQPILTITHQLRLVEFGQKSIQFALDYKKAGSFIIDRTLPEALAAPDRRVIYTVAADGTLLRGIAVNVSRELNRRWFVFWFIVINVVVLGAFIIAKVRTARKQGKD